MQRIVSSIDISNASPYITNNSIAIMESPLFIKSYRAKGLFACNLREEKLNEITHKLIKRENLEKFIREMEEMVLKENKTGWRKNRKSAIKRSFY